MFSFTPSPSSRLLLPWSSTLGPHLLPCAPTRRTAATWLHWVAMSNGRRSGGCTDYTWGYVDRHFSLSCVCNIFVVFAVQSLTRSIARRLSGILSLQVAIYFQLYTVDFSRNRMMVRFSLLWNSLHNFSSSTTIVEAHFQTGANTCSLLFRLVCYGTYFYSA